MGAPVLGAGAVVTHCGDPSYFWVAVEYDDTPLCRMVRLESALPDFVFRFDCGTWCMGSQQRHRVWCPETELTVHMVSDRAPWPQWAGAR